MQHIAKYSDSINYLDVYSCVTRLMNEKMVMFARGIYREHSITIIDISHGWFSDKPWSNT